MIFTGEKPIYETVADYFRKLISRGVLKEGQALPSVREVAMMEKINPNTVVRAYSILVEEGLVSSLPKKGYFVAQACTKDSRQLHAVLSSLLQEGYSKEDIIASLNEMTQEVHP